jgi:hypothetical protein
LILLCQTSLSGLSSKLHSMISLSDCYSLIGFGFTTTDKAHIFVLFWISTVNLESDDIN